MVELCPPKNYSVLSTSLPPITPTSHYHHHAPHLNQHIAKNVFIGRVPFSQETLVMNRQWWNFIKLGKHINIHKMKIYIEK